jgi:chromosome segregation ATPase
MFMKRSALIVAILLLSSELIATRKTSAQAPAPANDVNAALIRELHDLRVAIEKLASASSRVQVLSARVVQREQRISNLITELITLNSKLAEAAVDTSLANAKLEQLQESLRTEADPKQRAILEEAQAGFASDVNRKRVTQSSIQAQVDALRQQIVAEQSSLADIERRLDELDRPIPDSQR